MDSTIEVTDKEAYNELNYKTHMIERKVFLLSARELGVDCLDSVTTEEETPLKYFENKDYTNKNACLPNGTECPYLTRTPELWEPCTEVMIGVESIGAGTAEVNRGVRPTF